MASDLGSKTSNSDLVLALAPFATTTALTAVHAALTQVQSAIPYPGVSMAELTSLLLSYTTSTTTQGLNALVLQIQSDLTQKVSQASVKKTLGAYVTTSALQTIQSSIQGSINSILANMGSGGSGTSYTNGAAWLDNATANLILGYVVRNLAVGGPLSITEENDGNTLLLTADVFSKAESSEQLALKMGKTNDLVLATLSALNSKLILKGGISGFSLQNLAGTSDLISIDGTGNTTFLGNLYAPNVAQLSALTSYVKISDFFANLADYFFKDVVGTETILEIGKFQLVAGSGFFEIRQLFDFGPTPTDGFQDVCSFKLNNAGLGGLQLNGVDVATVGLSYTKAEANSLLANKANASNVYTTAQVDAKDLALSNRIDNINATAGSGN